MADAENYLFGGEQVALETRRHAVVLLKPALFPFFGLVLVSAYPLRFTLIVLLACIGRFAWSYLLWFKDRFVLTDNRIISTSGLITTSVVSMPLSKITDLTYTRSVGGRLLGYGKLHLESAGQIQLESIDHLPDPDHFYRCVMAFALGPPPEDVEEEVQANQRPKSKIFDIDALIDSDASSDDSSDDDHYSPRHSASSMDDDASEGGRKRETFEERRARIMAARRSE